VTVGTAFTDALTVDSAAAVAYTGTTAITAARSLITGVTTSAATTNVASTITSIKSGGGATAGQTFTLTTGIDVVAGGSGADTIIGDNNVTSAADQIDGGGGNDTIKLYGNASKPVLTSVETVYLSGNTAGMDVTTDSSVTLLDLFDPTTGQTYTVTTGQAVKVASVAAGETVTIAGNSPTSLAVTLDSFAASGNDATLALSGTALTSATITASGAKSQVTLTNAGAALTTINVAGDKALELGHALTTVTTINAAGSSGGVDVDTVGASALAFTGGSGNDRINMVATLTVTDVLVGGAGTDTLAISDADTLTAALAVGVSGFEILEATTADGTAYDVDTIITKNTLTGILVSETGGAATTVNNINAAAINNIRFTGNTPTATALTGKGFVTGGISDAATVILDNSVDDNADGVDVATTLTFTQVDRLTVTATSDDTTTARAIVNSITGLTATDLDILTINGNAAVSIATAATTAALQEVNASASTGAVTLDTSASAIASLIYKGNDKVDTLTFSNAASNSATVFTGGGSDVLVLGVTGAAHTLNFTATSFTGDVKAGDAITINTGAAFQATDTVTLDFSSAIEGLLKSAGTALSSAASNVTLVGTSFSAATNVIAIDGGNNTTLQFDLNGDGVFTAANDFSIEILGLANNTLNYIAATDVFVFTATA